MPEESIIPEELKKLIGVEEKPQVLEAERGHIKRYAEAVGDLNPLWRDEVYARKSRYGNIVAPPLFLHDQTGVGLVDKLRMLIAETKRGLTRFLNASMEVEFYKPIMAGDLITSAGKLVDFYEKQGKSGKMLFWTVESTMTNQRGELVSKHRHTFVSF